MENLGSTEKDERQEVVTAQTMNAVQLEGDRSNCSEGEILSLVETGLGSNGIGGDTLGVHRKEYIQVQSMGIQGGTVDRMKHSPADDALHQDEEGCIQVEIVDESDSGLDGKDRGDVHDEAVTCTQEGLQHDVNVPEPNDTSRHECTNPTIEVPLVTDVSGLQGDAEENNGCYINQKSEVIADGIAGGRHNRVPLPGDRTSYSELFPSV